MSRKREYWPQDITWCMNGGCKEEKCMRNQIHITNRGIPHSFAYMDGTEDCYKYQEWCNSCHAKHECEGMEEFLKSDETSCAWYA